MGAECEFWRMNDDDRQKRREEILQRLVLGQACIRGFLQRQKYHKMGRVFRQAMVARNAGLRDLIASESQYTSTLQHAIKYYIHPLRLDGSMLRPQDMDTIFNWVESINQAHTNALDQLRSLYNSQFPSIEGVGHIAEILVKGAKRYAEYISNSKYALNLLVKCQQDNPTFAKFMKQTEERLSQSKGPQQALNMPAIYALIIAHPAHLTALLETITTHTPEGHPDHVALRNCLSAMKRALVQVKKATEEAPLRAELLSVAVRISGYDILSAANGSQSPTQSGRGGDLTASSPSVIVAPPISPFLLARRKFVLEGAVQLNGQERYLFVFSDVIIATQPQKQKKGGSNSSSSILGRNSDAGQTAGLGERFVGGGGSGINDTRGATSLAPLSPDASDKKSRKSAKKAKSDKGSKTKDKERGKGKGKAPSEIEYRFKAEIPLKGATVSASPSTPRERGLTQSFSISSFSPRSSISSKEKEDLTFELVTARDERYLVTLGSADKKQVWLKEIKDLVHRLKPKGVFGVPLLELLVSEKKRKLGIPYIVFATTNHLLTHAIAEEDLFTQSASSSGVEDLRDAFEGLSRDSGEIDMTGKNLHNVADLLKLYFRDLPEPLFTYDVYDDLIKLKGTKEDFDKYRDDLKKVVSRLPLPNRTLLQYLIHFLLRISFCSELNRMNSATLALVFGPELIRPRQVTLESHLMFGKIQKILQTLMDHYTEIFF